MHYGTPRHSGRYPWGSGENPYQRTGNILASVNELKKEGLSEAEIAKALGMSTTQLRAKKKIAREEQRAADAAQALRLKDKGYSNVEIGRIMGKNESSIRSLLDPALSARNDRTKKTSEFLQKKVDEKGFIDVGIGVERELNVSKESFKTAIAMLEEKGYKVHQFQVDQLGTVAGNKTTVTVLAPPETEWIDVVRNQDKIHNIEEYFVNEGETPLGIKPPQSISSKKIDVRYAEDGGDKKDGLIEIRPGAENLSLGENRYAQVRIAVDGTHYMKGMAVYSDDIPKGVDVVFNTNKSDSGNKLDALKEMKADKDNPFGATIKRQQGAINIVNEQGDWAKWDKNLASQMLSKQSPKLAKQQLDLAYADKKREYEEIKSLTNPAVKKRLLDSFASDCDASAVHLKAAALPRQTTNVILPFSDIKDNEIYSPRHKNGESVVLIRYPHGGIFEIPQLKVNNKSKSAKKVIGNAEDAVGINSKVASRLSGADFDGDSVLVIPVNDKVHIRTSAPLKGLENFDPKVYYPAYEGMPKMKSKTKQTEMGKITNLITDMTLKGADEKEVARAVRHSMVVIDAEKHNLNYKQSYIDNNIADLKRKYQGSTTGGVSTLISAASSEIRVPYRKEKRPSSMTPSELKLYKEGRKIFDYPGSTYVDKKGKIKQRQTKITRMENTNDARTLSSGTRMENIYADHANKLKSLANQARKDYLTTGPIKQSPSAKKLYAEEVKSLNSKLNVALKNAPRERQAQIQANLKIKQMKADNPALKNDHEQLKKYKGQALKAARDRVGAKKQRIQITDREWEAIQAGAISNNKLNDIINNTDLDAIKERATPKSAKTMTASKISRAKALSAAGYTQAEIAEKLGVSTSTVSQALS